MRVRVIVSGRVQGVWFRESCRRQAQAHQVAGWVENRADGTVLAVFEGSSPAVAHMVAWCHEGPTQALVTGVEVTDEPLEQPQGFRVL
ncbi:MAG: acylphosphatase [Actinomycetota bacterium]|nr:acylphosphatase [Actinomycetota bacterium]